MAKTAKLIAELIIVLCPHCDEPIPNPDTGADGWLPDEITTAAQDSQDGCGPFCSLCHAQVRMPAPKTVPLRYSS